MTTSESLPVTDDPFKAVRALRTSTLDNHRMMYALLTSVEASLREARLPLHTDIYFEALLPLMSTTASVSKVEFQSTVVYLLALVAPHVDAQTVQRHYSALYAAITGGYQQFNGSPLYVRSMLVIVKAVLVAMHAVEEKTSKFDLFTILLHCSVDARPKVRKAAQEMLVECVRGGPFLTVLQDFVRECMLGSTKKDPNGTLHILPLCASMGSLLVPAVAAAYEHCMSLRSKFVTDGILTLLSTAAPTDAHRLFDAMCRDDASRVSPAWVGAYCRVGLSVVSTAEEVAAFVKEIVPDAADFGPWPAIERAISCPTGSGSLRPLVMGALVERALANCAWLKSHLREFAGAGEGLLLCLRTAIGGMDVASSQPCVELLACLGAIFSNPAGRGLQQGVLTVIGQMVRCFGFSWFVQALRRPEDILWLLPVIRDNVHEDSLALYFAHIFPLVARFAALEAGAKKPENAKRFAVIQDQAWSCMPAFFDRPRDLQTAFDTFSSDVLSQPLSVHVIHAIEHMFGKCREEDVEFVRGKCMLVMPLLLNAFSTTAPERREPVSQAIVKCLSRARGDDLAPFQARLLARIQSASIDFSELATLLDIECMLVAHVEGGFSLDPQVVVPHLSSAAPNVQKQAYRLLTLLPRDASLAPAVAEALPALRPGIHKFRLRLLETLTRDHLHVVPMFLPEVVLCLKDNSLKARQAAFDLIVAWAREMQSGPVLRASLSHGYLDGDKQASLDEFTLMLMAGFAGKTPHMISAAVTAATRLVFSFHAGIAQDLLDAVTADVCAFLGSASREVVKAAIGYVKMAVVCLPRAFLCRHLAPMVQGVLEWSRVHHQNFKVKTRHIVERLIRKIGFEPVLAATPDAHVPLMRNLERKHARAARRKAVPSQESERPDAGAREARKQSYEAAVYNSDDEQDSDGDAMVVDDGSEEAIDEGLRKALKRKLSALSSRSQSRRKLAAKSDALLSSEGESDDVSEVEDDFEFEGVNADGRLSIRLKHGKEDSDDE